MLVHSDPLPTISAGPRGSVIPINRGVGHLALSPPRAPEYARDSFVLAVAVLVTNAVQHGRGHLGPSVAYDEDEVRAEVTGRNPIPAKDRTPYATEASGCGLVLVAAASKNLGFGKDAMTTWCNIRVPSNANQPTTHFRRR